MERKEVLVVPAVSGVPFQVGSGEGVSTSPNPVPNLPKRRVAKAQSSSAAVESSQRPSGEELNLILVLETRCLWRWHNL